MELKGQSCGENRLESGLGLSLDGRYERYRMDSVFHATADAISYDSRGGRGTNRSVALSTSHNPKCIS